MLSHHRLSHCRSPLAKTTDRHLPQTQLQAVQQRQTCLHAGGHAAVNLHEKPFCACEAVLLGLKPMTPATLEWQRPETFQCAQIEADEEWSDV